MTQQLRTKPYEPLPIYDFESGFNLQREPWLLPTKAFEVLRNFRIRQGRIEKRAGIDRYAEVVHQYKDVSIGTGDGSTTNFTATLSNTPIRKESSDGYFRIEDESGQVVHDEDMDGSLDGDGTGTINYDTGALDVTFNSAPPDGDSILVTYNHLPSNPVMGIYSYYSAAGDRQLCIFDTRRMNVYYSIQERTQDVTGTDIWGGNESGFFQMEVWEGNGYIINGADPIYKYDGSTLSELPTDITGDGTNDINSCHFIFAYKGRLVALRPSEDGDLKPQRARWSEVGSDSNWEDGGYVDAPTLDWIMAAGFLGDRLIVVFERSVWALNYIGDVDLPFTWEKLIATEGCAAPMSLVPFANEVLFLGFVRFISCDGITTEHLSRQIPDFSLGFNQEYYDLVYGAVLEEEHEVLWFYPSFSSEQLDMTLALNYRNNSWSVMDVAGSSLGYYRTQTDYTWDQIDRPWNDIEWRWDSKEAQAGYPTTLIGHYDGTIHVLNRTGSDNGDPINARLLTKAFNPFSNQMRKARLGYIDIYYEIDPQADLVIRCYEWDGGSPYFETIITLDGPNRLNNYFRRIVVNGEAAFHQIELENSSANAGVIIHAIVPWMKAGAKLSEAM